MQESARLLWGWCHCVWKTDKSQWDFRGRERKKDWKPIEGQSLRAWQTRWDYLLPVWKRLRCDSFLGYVRKISLDVVFRRGCVISLKEAIAFERMGSGLWMTGYTCFYIKGELVQEARLSGGRWRHGLQDRRQWMGDSLFLWLRRTLKVRARCICVLGNLCFRLYQESVLMFWKTEGSPTFNSEESRHRTLQDYM